MALQAVLDAISFNAAAYIQVATFLAVMMIGLFLTRAVLMPLVARLSSRRSRDKKWIYSMKNLAGLAGIIITFAVALQAANFGNLLTVIGVFIAAITLSVGFGTREQVGNLVSGLFIRLDTPFVLGDLITAGDITGKVKKIELRETTLESLSGEILVVPNSYLSNNPLQNHNDGRKILDSVELKAAMRHAEEVQKLLEAAAEEIEEVEIRPGPESYITSIETGDATIELSYTIDEDESLRAVRSRILELVAENGKETVFATESEA